MKMTFEWNQVPVFRVDQQVFLALLLLFSSGTANVFAKTPLDILDDDWLEVRSPNFHIITDTTVKNAEFFVRDLEQFRHYLQQFGNIRIKQDIQPLKIYAFQRASTYKAFELPKNSAGVFFQASTGNFAITTMSGYRRSNKLQNFAQQILRHEYVHFAFFNSNFKGHVPTWYQEGMAEFMSTMRVYKGKLHYGEISLPRLAGVNLRMKVDIEALFKADRIPESRRKGNSFYAHALAFIHYCSANPEVQRQLLTYLKLVAKGASVDSAYEQSFQMNYEEMGKAIKSYLKKMKFGYYQVHLSNEHSPENVSVTRLSEEQLAFHLADLTNALGFSEDKDREVTLELLDRAIESGIAESSMALLHKFHILLNSNKREDAAQISREMERQLPEFPGTYDAQADLFVEDMSALLEANDPAWMEAFKKARGKYRRAIHMENGFLPALRGLAHVYSIHPGEDIDVTEGITAYELASYHLNYPLYDFEHAILLLRGNRPREARQLLEDVIARARDEELVQKARELKLGIIIEN